MKNNVQKKEDIEVIHSIINGMKNKKAQNIISLKFNPTHSVNYDYFIICDGNSTTHVNSIAESIIQNTLNTNNLKPKSKEGVENKTWILLDYLNIIIHVFYKKTRELYNIEDIWYDATVKRY